MCDNFRADPLIPLDGIEPESLKVRGTSYVASPHAYAKLRRAGPALAPCSA